MNHYILYLMKYLRQNLDELILNWLPIKLFAGEVSIERLEIPPSLAGQDANFGIEGQLRIW